MSYGEAHAGERRRPSRKQRRRSTAEVSVEEGEQVGTLGSKCPPPVDRADLRSDHLGGAPVRPRQLGREEDEIAEGEVLSTSEVDGVVRPSQTAPEGRAVRVGGEAGLPAHEQERAGQRA